MDISKKRKISRIITALLFFFFLFANIYTIRRLSYYAVELFLYDKLLVAYQVGGMNGVNNELEIILSQDRMPREIALAKTFKNNLGNLKAPDKFLKNAVEEKKKDIRLFRNLRNIAFVCIVALFLLRIMLIRSIKPESEKQ